jgi:hypothetical protein
VRRPTVFEQAVECFNREATVAETYTMPQRVAAEFFGTFWLVVGGCGSAVLASSIPGVGRAADLAPLTEATQA